MNDKDRSLIIAIEDQLSQVRTAILWAPPCSDEQAALQTFTEELTLWSSRTKRKANDDDGDNEKDGQAAETPKPKRMRKAEADKEQQCHSCLESFSKSDVHVIRSCKCAYCSDCFDYMISTHLESQEVARCCNHNVKPPKGFRDTHQELCERYEKLYKELDADNPMHCSNLACGTFMGNYRHLKRKVTCKTCGSASCAACRNPMSEHKGIHKLCPEDIDDVVMKEAVEQYQMQRCPNCYAVVEKKGGCNNVSYVHCLAPWSSKLTFSRCRCGTLFCYQCGDRKIQESSSCTCTGS